MIISIIVIITVMIYRDMKFSLSPNPMLKVTIVAQMALRVSVYVDSISYYPMVLKYIT